MNQNEIDAGKIAAILGDKDVVEYDINAPELREVSKAIHKAFVRLELVHKGIILEFDKSKNLVKLSRAEVGDTANTTDIAPERKSTKPKKSPATKRHEHTYYPPKITGDIMDILLDKGSHIVWLTGPTQCGKSVLLRHICSELNMVLYQVNCRGDMGSDSFFGEKKVSIDPETGQNYTHFDEGIVPTAMQEGLDENGDEVGPPGLLFIDEAAAMMSHVGIALNRMMESDDPRRTLVLDQDGSGKVIRSHSGFRIVFASNLIGRGATDLNSGAYTAQQDALDISLLNRVTAAFRMGYDKKVERKILQEKIGDDAIVGKIIQFRDGVRLGIKENKLSSPFSTQHLIGIADLYRIFKDLAKAIYYATFEFLLPEERNAYNELAQTVIGADLLQIFEDDDIDYM